MKVYCIKCERANKDTEPFCVGCGHPLKDPPVSEPINSSQHVPKYKMMKLCATSLIVSGVLEILFGVILFLAPILFSMPEGFTIAIPWALLTIGSGIMTMAIGETVSCVRDIGMNSFRA